MRILALRFSAFGDVAMTIPVVMALLEQHPEVEVVFVTRPFPAKLFPQHPRLKVLGVDVDKDYNGIGGLHRLYKLLKKEEVDAVADLHGVLRTHVVRNLFLLSGTKVAMIDKGREEKKALVRKENKERKSLTHSCQRYADVFGRLGREVKLSFALPDRRRRPHEIPKIGFAPFAAHQGKCLPEKKSRELLEQMTAKGWAVSLFGGKGELEQLERLSEGLSNVKLVAGAFDLKGELEFMAGLDAMVSMDSANMHLASLVGLPVVSVWGATHPDAGFLGYGQSLENAVQVDVDTLPCRPCSVFGNKPCWRGDYACLEWFDVSKVVERLENIKEVKSTDC